MEALGLLARSTSAQQSLPAHIEHVLAVLAAGLQSVAWSKAQTSHPHVGNMHVAGAVHVAIYGCAVLHVNVPRTFLEQVDDHVITYVVHVMSSGEA